MRHEDPWSQLYYDPTPPVVEDPNLLWFDSFVRSDAVLEATEFEPQYQFTVDGKKRIKAGSKRTTVGTKATVNGKAIALFKYMDKFLAIDDTCPHMGGALHLGDIEDIDGELCISCPKHHWPFSLSDGHCLVGSKYKAETYPVKIRRHANGTKTLIIGFKSFSSNLFSDDDF
ncbi:hypothetical protein Poli38472_002276 [Pythium oligandrum]|uniref:Rieske domain-containing protein n=1 Tax=Pythium oligandrum TaxID=41045 RepID=A0A8K1CIH5_PYTOL|nr:hypothetical protein Poli38472_002276 [Pythium oligandrum]|eukprot:TMW63335.1 hypothetical protein Poli38472_002276 [Pythium oligandrum]